MASLIVEQSAVSAARVQTRVTRYEKGGSSFIVEPVNNTDYKKQILNKGPKNVALLFELDSDGDHVLINALRYLKDNDPAAFAQAKASLATLVKQLRTL